MMSKWTWGGPEEKLKLTGSGPEVWWYMIWGMRVSNHKMDLIWSQSFFTNTCCGQLPAKNTLVSQVFHRVLVSPEAWIETILDNFICIHKYTRYFLSFWRIWNLRDISDSHNHCIESSVGFVVEIGKMEKYIQLQTPAPNPNKMLWAEIEEGGGVSTISMYF